MCAPIIPCICYSPVHTIPNAAQDAFIYLKERFQVEQILQSIQNENMTVFFGVPTMYSMIIHFSEINKFRISL